MERKYTEDDLEQAIRRTAPGGRPQPDFDDWQQKYPNVLHAGENGIGARADPDRSIASVIRFGRTIMKRRHVRLGAAAVVLLGVIFLGRGTDKAWSLDQTIAAMKKIETVYITGKNLCGGEMVDFECWVHAPTEDADFLRLRYQCGCERKTTVVVRGNTVYQYRPKENRVRILDGSKIEDLQYWYEGATISPWLTGKLLETLKLVGRGWEQRVETDPNTGQERMLVTCSHAKSNISGLLVVDPQSKLVLKAKLWKNLERQGDPHFDAQVITYNPEIPDAFFEFKMPPGATVITDEETDEVEALFERAEQRFHQDRDYAGALELYQQVYDKYPHVGRGSTSLMMMGICYTWLGDNTKAIELYQKALREFPAGWEGVIQFYLGAAYMDNGQTQEALEAFEACLKDADGKRAPDQFPIKEAREGIARLNED